MESWQWFLLGVMAGWTPGLLALAIILMRATEVASNVKEPSND